VELERGISRGEYLAITIGGNHSREAFQTLIKQGAIGWDRNFSVRCDVFFNLTEEEARALGFVDNVVGNASRGYSLQNKVSLIRDLFAKQIYLASPGVLNQRALDLACFSYMYQLKKQESKQARTTKIQRSMPFIKACNVPESIWPIVYSALGNEKLTMQIFRSINWKFSPERLAASFEDFSLGGDVVKLKEILNSIKAM
jgi:hypothetical protein